MNLRKCIGWIILNTPFMFIINVCGAPAGTTRLEAVIMFGILEFLMSLVVIGLTIINWETK